MVKSISIFVPLMKPLTLGELIDALIILSVEERGNATTLVGAKETQVVIHIIHAMLKRDTTY